MTLPQLLHSTRTYGRANSAFSWKLLVLERGFLSYRLKLPCDRSAKDAWFGYSPVGALRKLPFILCSQPAVTRANTRQHQHPCRLRYGTSRVSRGTAADRLAIRIWDSADLLAYQRPLSARRRHRARHHDGWISPEGGISNWGAWLPSW